MNNNKKLSKNSGVFISELVVALLLFITLMVTAFVMSRNSSASLRQNMIKSDANFVAVQNLEYCLATDYDKLDSYTLQSKRDNVTYNISATITKLSDQDFSKENLVKKIEVKVTYLIDGNEKEIVISTLKGKVQDYE